MALCVYVCEKVHVGVEYCLDSCVCTRVKWKHFHTSVPLSDKMPLRQKKHHDEILQVKTHSYTGSGAQNVWLAQSQGRRNTLTKIHQINSLLTVRHIKNSFIW